MGGGGELQLTGREVGYSTRVRTETVRAAVQPLTNFIFQVFI